MEETGYILRFDEADAERIEVVGGKVASLVRLTRGGFPVPPGFCLTTAAYDHHLRVNGLAEKIAALAATSDPTMASRIRAWIAEVPVPPDLAAALRGAYHRLGEGACAVRSSAVAEDQPGASFAGQHETVLNVVGEEALLEAVRHCWASLWIERAVAYRAQRGLDPAQARMAVAVQKLVPAEAAGVMFTVDPVTGDQDRVVIEASFGLGEAIVAGLVTPDRYVVAKGTLAIEERAITEKGMLVRASPAGGTIEEAVPEAQRQAPVLADSGIKKLAEMGRRVEALYGSPQDIEWALYEGQFCLLQARPVTGLATPSDELIVWSCANTREAVPGVVCYLTRSIAKAEFDNATVAFLESVGIHPKYREYVDLIYGRVYMNLTHMLDAIGGLPGFSPEAIGYPEAQVPRRSLASQLAGAPARLWTTLRLLWRLPRVMKDVTVWEQEELPRFRDQVAGVRQMDLAELSTTEVQKLLTEFQQPDERIWNIHVTVSILASSLFGAFSDLVGRWCEDEGMVTDLMTGLPGMSSAEIGRGLWQLSRLALQSPPVQQALTQEDAPSALENLRVEGTATDFFVAWDEFLAHHGDRGFSEMDLSQPRFEEDLRFVVTAIRGYMEVAGEEDPLTRQERRREEATVRALTDLSFGQRPIFRWLLRQAQTYSVRRENAKAAAVSAQRVFRRCYRELGRRLAVKGLLEETDEVFFLLADEVDDLVAGRWEKEAAQATIAARQREYERDRRVEPPEVIIGHWEPTAGLAAPSPELQPDVETLAGLGASAGWAMAPAQVLTDPLEGADRFRQGEILVTTQTDPAWTYLFARASAVVTERGGLLSHGAIVAREYGIPAVAGAIGATRIIQTGQRIGVDGTRGIVFLNPEEGE